MCSGADVPGDDKIVILRAKIEECVPRALTDYLYESERGFMPIPRANHRPRGMLCEGGMGASFPVSSITPRDAAALRAIFVRQHDVPIRLDYELGVLINVAVGRSAVSSQPPRVSSGPVPSSCLLTIGELLSEGGLRGPDSERRIRNVCVELLKQHHGVFSDTLREAAATPPGMVGESNRPDFWMIGYAPMCGGVAAEKDPGAPCVALSKLGESDPQDSWMFEHTPIGGENAAENGPWAPHVAFSEQGESDPPDLWSAP